MKWVVSDDVFAIGKACSQALLHKAEAFAREAGTSEVLHLALVTPRGAKRNACRGTVAAAIDASDLFA